EGWRRWRSWMRQVKESGLAPLQRFGRNLSKYMRGILASANYPMHTSVLVHIPTHGDRSITFMPIT
ncbi:transposase, partial [Aeromonas sp. Prich7-2]|nr:transposase [Aeromonas sp. Prich7-2]